MVAEVSEWGLEPCSHGTGKIAALRCFFVLKGTAFRCFILKPVPDDPLVRLWGSIGTKISIWVVYEKQ